MISGLAPGKAAETEIVGKSTWGSGETGSNANAMDPASATAIVSSVVATGLAMKGEERLTLISCSLRLRLRTLVRPFAEMTRTEIRHLPRHLVEEKVDHRRRVQ